MPTEGVDLNQVYVQESYSIQELSPNQGVKIHIHFSLTKCDFPKSVIHVQDL